MVQYLINKLDNLMHNNFINKVKKVNGPRKHKITNSYGKRDYYRHYCVNRPKEDKYNLTQKEYYRLYDILISHIIESFLESLKHTFPLQMGQIELRKARPRVYEKKGKTCFTHPIDWHKTLQWWSQDDSAYSNRKLIRRSENWVFKLLYIKGKAKYSNKTFFKFRFNRNIKKRLKELISLNKIDTFEL